MASRLIRLNELATTSGKPGMVPMSPATVWRLVKAGKFPKPIKLSERVTAWESSKVEAFLKERGAA